MTPHLYAAWLSDDVAVHEYVDVLDSIPGVLRRAVYQPDAGGPAIQEFGRLVSRIEDHPITEPPAAFVLAELETIATSVAVGAQFGAPSSASGAAPVARYVMDQVIMHETTIVPGPEHVNYPDFGPAVQFGVLNVKSVDTEWHFNEWYERVRFPGVVSNEGQIRTRRFVTLAGRAKFGILYEFESLEARLTGFEEPHEARTLDPEHPTSQLRAYTVHAPYAPYIGKRIA